MLNNLKFLKQYMSELNQVYMYSYVNRIFSPQLHYESLDSSNLLKTRRANIKYTTPDIIQSQDTLTLNSCVNAWWKKLSE